MRSQSRIAARMAINVEAGVKKRMRINSQCINQIRVSGNHTWRPRRLKLLKRLGWMLIVRFLDEGLGEARSNRSLFRCQRPQVSGNCDNVVLGQMCDRTLHKRDRFTSARTILNIEKLSRDIDGLQARESRNLAQAL